MPNASPADSLAELAASYPNASRVFQHHRLDFCCKGNRSLDAACRGQKLDPSQVLSEIMESNQRPRDWDQLALDELVMHVIVRYHRPAESELSDLLAMAKRVEGRHHDKDGCPIGLHAFLVRWAEELALHMQDEETVLFPTFLQSEEQRSVTSLHLTETEHESHDRAFGEVRRLTGDFEPPAAACSTWRALYLRLSDFERELMEHAAFEQQILFPRAVGQVAS